MTFRGTIRNGKVELEPGADLPEGTSVDVNARVSKQRRKKSPNYDRLSDPAFRLSELAVPSGRKDGSAQTDHYVYGRPKRPSQRTTGVRKKKPKSSRARR